MRNPALLLTFAVVAVGCAVGPNYTRPDAPVPSAYKERPQAETGGAEWKPAQPADEARRGSWWEAFGDPGLNELEERVAAANQTVAQAEAAFRGARAAARLARGGLFPTLGATGSVTRSNTARGASSGGTGGAPATTTYALGADLSWEADVFGRIRRNLEAGVAGAQASAADLAAARLAIQAELAADYFALHGLDAEKQLLDTTVAAYATALRLTTNRYNQGIVSGVDVAQAQTQLETTRAQAIDLGVARAQLEHAIAVLLGKPPAEVSLGAAPIAVEPPEIPVGLPSELLERRPDVAAAERRVAVANAGIGVATAAYFPVFTLSGSGGWQAATTASFFSLPNRVWSLGPALAATLFDGGRRRAVREEALASYDASVAGYREDVLTAFEEVEDDLAALRILADEAKQQAVAVAAAEHALALARNRYDGGITTYLEVVTAQTVALANERAAVDLHTRRMTASVDLVKALGGGWRASDLPAPGAVLSRADLAGPPAPLPTPTPTSRP